MLGDTEKEIRFAYVGLAVASTLIARRPELVEKYLRSVIKGREYARRYREQTITILGKYTQRIREFNEVDYDSTLPVLTAEGWVGDDIIKEDVAMRAELVNVPAPSDYNKFFDYSIVRKIYRDLKNAARGRLRETTSEEEYSTTKDLARQSRNRNWENLAQSTQGRKVKGNMSFRPKGEIWIFPRIPSG